MFQVREALKSRLSPEYELYEHVRRRLLSQYAEIYWKVPLDNDISDIIVN